MRFPNYGPGKDFCPGRIGTHLPVPVQIPATLGLVHNAYRITLDKNTAYRAGAPPACNRHPGQHPRERSARPLAERGSGSTSRRAIGAGCM